MTRAVALLIVALAAGPMVAGAQDAAPVDVTKMGVSLDRLRRELGQAEAREQTSNHGLNLHFTVEVFGEAPRIDLLKDFPLIGPVPYGGPTHQDVLDVLTPQEFRSPVVPFSAMAVWAAQKLFARTKKQRCEDELAEYKRAVMAGIAIAAPRCTQ